MVAANPIVQSKFPLGQVVATPGALDALERASETPVAFIARHRLGDWGEVCDSDKKLNDDAVVQGERLMSAYSTRLGEKVWVITEADRSSTTLLLPEEY